MPGKQPLIWPPLISQQNIPLQKLIGIGAAHHKLTCAVPSGCQLSEGKEKQLLVRMRGLKTFLNGESCGQHISKPTVSCGALSGGRSIPCTSAHGKRMLMPGTTQHPALSPRGCDLIERRRDEIFFFSFRSRGKRRLAHFQAGLFSPRGDHEPPHYTDRGVQFCIDGGGVLGGASRRARASPPPPETARKLWRAKTGEKKRRANSGRRERWHI